MSGGRTNANLHYIIKYVLIKESTVFAALITALMQAMKEVPTVNK